MLEQNEKFCAENGGADGMPDEKRRIYEGRKRRLAALANYFDATEALIQGLTEWVDELTAEKRRLTSKLRDFERPWESLAQNHPDGWKETRREQTHIRARIQFPHLY
jgi:chromosome segregation ATPase